MIAYEYANAIYDIAVEEKKVDLFNDYFLKLQETLSGDFLKLLLAPNVEALKKKDVIKKVYESIDKTFVDFLCVLIDNGRIDSFASIGHQYRKFVRKDKKIVIIDVYTAEKLSTLQLENIKQALQGKYPGKKLEMKNMVKPNLIGGMQIISNGESIDMSLKSTIERLKETL